MENISQMSLIEVAVYLMEQKRTPQNIYSLIKEVLEMKGYDESSVELKTQLYVDLVASSKFVYMGNDEWDLKIRQSLDQFDKDGSAFNSKDDEYVEEEETIEEESFDDEEIDNDDEDDEDRDDDDDEDDDDADSTDSFNSKDYIEEETDDDYDDDDDSSDHYDEDFDEDKYNDYMDDFENMYED